MEISLRVINQDHKLVRLKRFTCEEKANKSFIKTVEKVRGSNLSAYLLFDFRDEELEIA